MGVPGLLHGLVTKFAAETADERRTQREREDKDFVNQLHLLEALRTDPRTTPEMYQRVIADTIKLNKGLSKPRAAKGGVRGFLTGQTDTEPFASQVLQQMADGSMPIFHDKQTFDQARSGTLDDLPGGANNPQAPPQQSQSGASVAGSMPATPPPPMQQPPKAELAGQSPSPVTPPNIGAARPEGTGAQPAAPAAPPGPVPSPPGTGSMAEAAKGLTEQVSLGGPVLPTAPSQSDIFSAHKASPSAFYSPVEKAQLDANAANAGIPIQARTKYDTLRGLNMDPRLATLAVAKDLTGFSGTTTSRPGQLYVNNATGELVKSILQADNFGGFQEIDPQTRLPIGQDMEPYIPGVHQVIVDAKGVARVINKASASATGVPGVGQPGAGGQGGAGAPGTTGGTTGSPRSLTSQPGVGPSLGAIGKPQIPPPVYSGNFTGIGADGQPIQLGIPREGGPAVPIPVQNVPGFSVPKEGEPPAPGQVPVPPKKPGEKSTATYTPKYEPEKPLDASAQSVMTSVGVVESTAKRALDVINKMEAQGYNMNTPIGQTIDKWLYAHGWNADELESQLFQNVGANEANALKTVMGGRPNMKLIDILQMHTAQPGDALSLLKEKLQGLLTISNDMRQSVLTAANTYKDRPYSAPGGGNRTPETPQAPAKPVTKELVQKYATQHNIPYAQALKVFTDKGYKLSNAAPAAK